MRYEVQIEKPNPDTPFNVMIEMFLGTFDGLHQARNYRDMMRGRGFNAVIKKTMIIE
jgi:cell division septation protein DedD